MSQCQLTILANPQIQDSLLDWLLQQSQVKGFSTTEIYGHSSEVNPAKLSLLEQVTGRRKRVKFSMHLEEEEARQLLDALRVAFARSGIHYTLLPVLAAGHLL